MLPKYKVLQKVVIEAVIERFERDAEICKRKEVEWIPYDTPPWSRGFKLAQELDSPPLMAHRHGLLAVQTKTCSCPQAQRLRTRMINK